MNFDRSWKFRYIKVFDFATSLLTGGFCLLLEENYCEKRVTICIYSFGSFALNLRRLGIWLLLVIIDPVHL